MITTTNTSQIIPGFFVYNISNDLLSMFYVKNMIAIYPIISKSKLFLITSFLDNFCLILTFDLEFSIKSFGTKLMPVLYLL